MFWSKKCRIPARLALFLVVIVGSASIADESNPVDDYRLDTGDRILIKVFEEDELTVETTLNDRGIINYSFLGELRISSQTTREVEQLLTSRLKDGYLKNPSVSVSVLQYRPFFITGEVRTPGDYPFQPGLTLEKAVSVAGGFTDRASRRKIFLQRGSTEKKARMRFQDRVQPGDIITVEEGFF
ncbi:MAG: polysaccharide biosynthesis/export family protein [Pseudomonadota bacterium]